MNNTRKALAIIMAIGLSATVVVVGVTHADNANVIEDIVVDMFDKCVTFNDELLCPSEK